MNLGRGDRLTIDLNIPCEAFRILLIIDIFEIDVDLVGYRKALFIRSANVLNLYLKYSKCAR